MYGKQRLSLTRIVPFAGALTVAMAWGACAQTVYSLRPSPEQIALARDTCVNVMRIRQGFLPFHACVESLSQTLSRSNRAILRESATSRAMGRPEETSYSESNPEERRRKEEYSCFQLGMLPGSSGFSQCVTELDSALRSVEHTD